MSELQARSARRLATLTISDAGSKGERQDTSGPAISEVMTELGYVEIDRVLVPDEADQISRQLAAWCDGGEVDIVLTTGGTGLSPRDVTPEATRSVIEYEIPGIPEAIRTQTAASTRMAMLSRAVAGIRSGCLVINLPGSPTGVREALAVIGPVIGHAIDIARDRPGQSGHGDHTDHDSQSDHSGHKSL
jgi:molybdenum cofactor synthesis domain-containing protein